MNQQKSPQHLYQALNNYIDSYTYLTGAKPDFIPVTKQAKELYAIELEKLGNDFGLWQLTGTYPKSDKILKKKLIFSGIELKEQ